MNDIPDGWARSMLQTPFAQPGWVAGMSNWMVS